MRQLTYLIFLAFTTGCLSSRKAATSSLSSEIREIRLINEYIYPHALVFKNTIIGGLSGIDYDAKRDLYYMISDDPSSKGPARYYTARILIGDKGIDTVIFVDATPLLDPQGQPFPDITKDRVHSADVEAIRYDPLRDELIWSSEGQRIVSPVKNELQDPAIVIMGRDGHYKDSLPLPDNMHVHATEAGPRHNSVFEGLAFDENYQHLYVSVEDAIYGDGPRAGVGADSTAWIRILKFDRKSKRQLAQYAYRVDPVPYPPVPPGAFHINGVSDIMYLGDQKLLVIERAFSVGRTQSDIRIYIADTKNARDVSGMALNSFTPDHPVTKKLLLDMNSLHRFIDNIEGVTFGPLLPNGHRSLIFVVDDNFDKRQKNQFFLFEVIP